MIKRDLVVCVHGSAHVKASIGRTSGMRRVAGAIPADTQLLGSTYASRFADLIGILKSSRRPSETNQQQDHQLRAGEIIVQQRCSPSC